MTVMYRKVCACEKPLHFDPTFTLKQLPSAPGDPIHVTVTMTQGPTCSKCGTDWKLVGASAAGGPVEN